MRLSTFAIRSLAITMIAGLILSKSFTDIYAAEASTLTHDKSGLTIDIRGGWKRQEPNVPVNFLLICKKSGCDEDTRAFINTSFSNELSSASTNDFLNNLSEDRFVQQVKKLVARVGQIERTINVESSSIGGKDAYVGDFEIKYRDGRDRHLTYGLTFSDGWFYHFQVFGHVDSDNSVYKIARELFSQISIGKPKEIR